MVAQASRPPEAALRGEAEAALGVAAQDLLLRHGAEPLPGGGPAEEGGGEGVKLEEQILITATGSEPLSTYPLDLLLLGREV